MIYLIFAVLSSVGVIHLLKLGSHRGIGRFPLFAVNYAVAFGAGLFEGRDLSTFASLPLGYWLLAASVGAAFVLAFFALSRAVEEAGPALATTVSRLAIAIPVLVSIVLFREEATRLQLFGLLLTLLILPLSAPEPPFRRAPEKAEAQKTREWSALLWLLLLFALFGFNDVAFKVRQEFYPAQSKAAFTTILFGVALLLTGVATIVGRWKVGRETVLLGAFLGIVNYFSAFWLIRALQVLPGYKVYPLNSLGIILLAAITATLIWKERPKRHHYLFYTGAAIAIYLLS